MSASRTNLSGRRGLHQEVVDQIGFGVVSGERVGAMPSQDELASEYGVSRSVIREAVQVLAAKGLVEARPKLGMRALDRSNWHLTDPSVIAWLSSNGPEDSFFDDVMDVRLLLEPALARRAAALRSDEMADQMLAIQQRMETETNQESFMAADREFHALLARMGANTLLAAFVGALDLVLSTAWTITSTNAERRQEVIALHGDLALSIADQDADRAERCMQAIIQSFGSALDQARDQTNN